jgi:hypothetical protein
MQSATLLEIQANRILGTVPFSWQREQNLFEVAQFYTLFFQINVFVVV